MFLQHERGAYLHPQLTNSYYIILLLDYQLAHYVGARASRCTKRGYRCHNIWCRNGRKTCLIQWDRSQVVNLTSATNAVSVLNTQALGGACSSLQQHLLVKTPLGAEKSWIDSTNYFDYEFEKWWRMGAKGEW